MRKVILLSFIIVILLISQSFASFPPMLLNARAVGLGEAYSALSDDWGALVYNPAGLTYVDKINVGFTHLEMPESWTRVEFLGGVLPLNKISLGFGASLKSIANSEELLFPFSENAFQVSVASKVMPNLSLGATLYLYLTTLDTGSAQGFGVDLGAIYELNPNINLSLALYNPVSYLKWSTGTVENVERKDVVLGGMFKLNLGNIPLKFLADVSLLEKINFLNRVHVGTEVNFLPFLTLRTGYDGAKEGVTFGLGVNFSNLNFDYAFLYTQALTPQHVISLSGKF
ncbi:MAG: hypothetical protein CBR30_04775 [Dictyoglomus sp. NZ13-RE01]|nr:MAG: hypothetical protein CBR30_04775 [Dictyoglomus sp. NZ13-RE01]